MSLLYIIRHAPVRIEPDIPAAQWRLSEEGLNAASQLAASEHWLGVRTIWHSPESKAQQTAQKIADRAGLTMRIQPSLTELEMHTGFLTAYQFQQRVALYLQGEADAD